MTDQRTGTLEKDKGLLLRIEGQFFRVIGIVQAERNDRSGLERGQPNHVGFGYEATVLETQTFRAGTRSRTMNGA